MLRALIARIEIGALNHPAAGNREDVDVFSDPHAESQGRDQQIIAVHTEILIIHSGRGARRSEIVDDLEIRVETLYAVASGIVGDDHVLVRVFEILDAENIISVSYFDGVFKGKGIGIHDENAAGIFGSQGCIKRDIDLIGAGVIGHPVAVLPVEIIDAFGEGVLLDVISILVVSQLVIGGNGVRLIGILRCVLNSDNIVVGTADRLDHAVGGLDIVLEDDIPLHVVEGVVSGDLCADVCRGNAHKKNDCQK